MSIQPMVEILITIDGYSKPCVYTVPASLLEMEHEYVMRGVDKAVKEIARDMRFDKHDSDVAGRKDGTCAYVQCAGPSSV